MINGVESLRVCYFNPRGFRLIQESPIKIDNLYWLNISSIQSTHYFGIAQEVEDKRESISEDA